MKTRLKSNPMSTIPPLVSYFSTEASGPELTLRFFKVGSPKPGGVFYYCLTNDPIVTD